MRYRKLQTEEYRNDVSYFMFQKDFDRIDTRDHTIIDSCRHDDEDGGTDRWLIRMRTLTA